MGMVERERIIRELASEIVRSHRRIAGEGDPRHSAEELARSAVFLVCDRPRSVWSELIDKLCQLALPEFGGFARLR